jgi:hypothetical protein
LREPSAVLVEAGGARISRASLALLFGVAISLGAFLLFWIQPMFGKLVLPKLGGAPNVWITAMLFFQTMLLAGYGYAHLTSRYMPLRWQVAVHLSVLLIGLVSLPIGVASVALFEGSPISWLIALLAVSIGAPFFAVSATAPLMQRWFAHSGHPEAADPYFLYAGSNIGSIVALLSFPVLLEPLFGLDGQGWGWSIGYGFLIALTAACGFGLLRNGVVRAAAPAVVAEKVFAPVDARQRLWWIGLAFVPSSLMLGVTTRITTDVAAVPLLWVIPLTLYLLSYVLTFARHHLLSHRWMVRAQPYLMVLGLISIAHTGIWPLFFIDILVFFVIAMVCHGELNRRRPAASQLTDFYLCIAFGGMLGGVFNAIVAPLLFSGAYEYPIALIAAALLRPGRTGGVLKTRVRDVVLPLLLFILMVLLWVIFDINLKAYGWLGFYLFFVAAGIFLIAFKGRRIRFSLAMAATILVTALIGPGPAVLDRSRSFFGVYKVVNLQNGTVNALKHGSTLHGAQYADPDRWREPLTYYTREGPVGQFFDALNANRPPGRVGLLGLGVGTILCHGRSGQRWTIYEIDPLIERLARDTRYFHYLSECFDSSTMQVVYGDARLSLTNAGRREFDLLILDAFNSDAVPMHLLTREAFALYRERLSDGGLILLNFSNRHLDLRPVLAGLVADAGMYGLFQMFSPAAGANVIHAPSSWVVIGRNKADLQFLAGDARWLPLSAETRAIVWSDDFSDLLGVISWRVNFHGLSDAWNGTAP